MHFRSSWLTRPVRLSIAISLVVLFFVISPLVVFYTSGYRYDFSTNSIQQTGVISVDLEPETADVYLNDVQILKKIPIRLANRAPGTYHIRVEQDGFYPWEKDITVKSKKTTYIQNLTLFQKTLPAQLLEDLDTEILSATISSDASFILLTTKQKNVFDIQLYTPATNRLDSILRTTSLDEPHIEWSPFTNLAAITVSQAKNTTELYLFSPNDLTSLAHYSFPSSSISKFMHWSDSFFNPSINIQSGKNINQLSLGNQNTSHILPTTQTPWYIDDKNKLWTLNDTNLTNKNESIDLSSYLDNNKTYTIAYLDSNKFIVQSEASLIVGKHNKLEAFDVRKFDFTDISYDSQNNDWLLWGTQEVWKFDNNGNTTLINRSGSGFNLVRPFANYSELVFVNNKTLAVFNPGYYTTQTLIENSVLNIEDLQVNTKLRKIFMFGSINNVHGLYELRY